MNIDDLYNIKDNTKLIDALYRDGFEDTRLSRSKSSTVEYITTMRVLREYVTKNSSVLDLGAGAGVYTLPLSVLAKSIDAVELANENARLLRQKSANKDNIRVFHQSASDLSNFCDNSYDIVMLMGPLYHIFDITERDKCISEAIRVCKPDGVIMAAFISNDAVPLTECCYRDFFNPCEPHSYDHDTFEMENFPFVFYTLTQMRAMLTAQGIRLQREVATDGVSELLQDKIDAMSDESFAEYLKFHLYCSEKPEMLGRSNHVLLIGNKAS